MQVAPRVTCTLAFPARGVFSESSRQTQTRYTARSVHIAEALRADLLLPARRHLEPLRAAHAVPAREDRRGSTYQLSLQRPVDKYTRRRPAVVKHCTSRQDA